MQSKTNNMTEIIDFNGPLTELRNAIDNAVGSLMRNNNKTNVDITDEHILIEDDTTIGVDKVGYEELNDTFNIVLHLDDGFEKDFTDCSTDDMIAIYQAVYRQINYAGN